MACFNVRWRRKWSWPREIMLLFLQSPFPCGKQRENWTSPLPRGDHRSWNTPALTKMYQRNLSSAWRLYSCATFLRAQSNLPGQNSRFELSCFPPQNFHSEHVNESTQSLLLLVRKQEMQSLHKNTSVQNSPPHLVEMAAFYSGKGRLLCWTWYYEFLPWTAVSCTTRGSW